MPKKALFGAALASFGLLATLPALAQLSTVATAGPNETVQGLLNGQQGLARTADGRLWALTYFNDGKGNFAKSQFDRIHVSTDNGQTWQLATTIRTPGAVRGSMRTGNDGTTLHVVWQGNDSTTSTAHYSIYYATYDTVQGAWNGTDFTVAAGANSNNQYQSPDVVITPMGTVVVAYNGHRQTPSWSGRMRVLKNNTWSTERQVNADTYGIQQDVQAHGEDVYFSYRTNSGLYGIRCRRFDTVADAWGAEGEMQVSQANTTNTDPASSGNAICVTPSGDIHVLYAKGKSSAGSGELWIGIAPAGTYAFTNHIKVDDDAAMLGGNNTYYHYALARTGSRVNVLYSKLSESNAKLYLRWVVSGQLFPPIAVTQASGAAQEFDFVSAHRDPLGEHGMMALLTDRGTTGGRVQALVVPRQGSALMHGVGCMGTLAAPPSMRAATLPAPGGSYDFAFADLPASTAALFLLGGSRTQWGPVPLPLPLDGLGMTGCLLHQDILISASFLAQANGTATLQVPLPLLPGLAGLPLYTQAFVLAPGANGGNAVMTNGIAGIPR